MRIIIAPSRNCCQYEWWCASGTSSTVNGPCTYQRCRYCYAALIWYQALCGNPESNGNTDRAGYNYNTERKTLCEIWKQFYQYNEEKLTAWVIIKENQKLKTRIVQLCLIIKSKRLQCSFKGTLRYLYLVWLEIYTWESRSSEGRNRKITDFDAQRLVDLKSIATSSALCLSYVICEVGIKRSPSPRWLSRWCMIAQHEITQLLTWKWRAFQSERQWAFIWDQRIALWEAPI